MQEDNGQLSIVALPDKHKSGHGKKSFWHVNRDMLPYKIHFFLLSACTGAIWPYLSVIGIVKLGLTASNIAAAYTAQQIILIFIKPCIGYVADYFNNLKATVVGLTLVQAIFCFFMIIIPNTDMPGIPRDLSSRTLQSELLECRFCNKLEDVTATVSQKSLDELNFERTLNCFNDAEKEYGALTCSREYTHFSTSLNVFYKIIYRPCDSLNKIFVSSINNRTTSGARAHTALFILLSSNASQNSIICFLEEQMLHVDEKHLTHNCQRLSEHQSVVLQNIMPSFKTLNCSTVNAINLVKEEPTVSFSMANFETYQFWVYSVCLVIYSTAISSILTASDTACYESMPNVNFGQQRAWGAIGYGFMAFLAGFLNDYTDSFIAAWCLMALMCCLKIANLSRMNLVKTDCSQNILQDLKIVFSSMEFLIFEAGVFMNGIFDSVIMFFLPWFLSSIGGNELVIGLANIVQCYLGEVPFLFISSWLIKKLGHFNLLSLALMCYGVRFFAYSYLHDPWWILPIEITQGITYGLFLSVMTSYGKLNSKPGAEATTQSLLSTTYEGPSAALGCLIFGICFDYYGGHATFFYASFVCGFTALISSFSTILIRSRSGELRMTKTSSACAQRY